MRVLLVFLAAFVLPGQATLDAPATEHALDDGRPAKTAEALSFDKDVQPLFAAKCVRCHGQKVQKAALDLRTLPALLKGSESGPVVVPGNPDESPLYELISDGEMPADKKGPLTEAEVETVRRWIEAGARSGTRESTPAPVVSQLDVIPLMLLRCTVCHGLRQQDGGLDLRSTAAMLKGGKSGPAIIPGKPADSLLIKSIRSGEMPPRTRLVEVSVKPMEPAEVDLVERWIALGAPEVPVEPDIASTEPDPLVSDSDRAFWSFQPPRPVDAPQVRHAQQVRNPIDAFIIQKLEAKGLTLSPEADRITLLRRVSFDLTGLPPEPGGVQAFLADRDARAYEKMVDRLLASPRYGERWGRHWLDLVGYADSEGKREQDLPRPFAYSYRDYVIRALNDDKPSDRFLLEHVAGDELLDHIWHRRDAVR